MVTKPGSLPLSPNKNGRLRTPKGVIPVRAKRVKFNEDHKRVWVVTAEM